MRVSGAIPGIKMTALVDTNPSEELFDWVVWGEHLYKSTYGPASSVSLSRLVAMSCQLEIRSWARAIKSLKSLSSIYYFSFGAYSIIFKGASFGKSRIISPSHTGAEMGSSGLLWL